MYNFEIPRETRRESHEEVKRKKALRYAQVMEVLGTSQKTVDEVIDGMMERGYLRYPDRNSVAPRLTELVQKHIVRICGKAKSHKTGKTVSVYEIKRMED